MEKKMKIKGAIFDMDGTLADSMILWEIMWAEIGKIYMNDEGFKPDPVFDKSLRVMTLRDAMFAIHDFYGFGESGEALNASAKAICHDFYANRVELKPGAREFLDRLKAKGIPMCLATATSPDLIKLSMAHCGMEEYFDVVISCTEVGKGKEEPDIFLEARKRLGTPLEETWVFEDSLVALKTAKKLGMPVVGIYDAYNFGHEEMRELSDHYIADGEGLDELASMRVFD